MHDYNSLKEIFNELSAQKQKLTVIPIETVDILIDELTEMSEKDIFTEITVPMLAILKEVRLEREFKDLMKKVDTYFSEELYDCPPSDYISQEETWQMKFVPFVVQRS